MFTTPVGNPAESGDCNVTEEVVKELELMGNWLVKAMQSKFVFMFKFSML